MKNTVTDKKVPKPLAPYIRHSADKEFNVRRKSHVYRKRIKKLIELAKNLGNVTGKLDAIRRASVHYFADVSTPDSDRRMARSTAPIEDSNAPLKDSLHY